MSELARRIAFSVVAIPVAIATIYFGGAPLAALLSAVAALGAWELFRMARAGGIEPLDSVGIPLAALVPLWVHARFLGIARGGAWRTDGTPAPARMLLALFGISITEAAVLLLGLLALAIWARGVAGRPLAAVAVTAFGVAYTGGMLSFGYALRYHDYAVGRAAGAAVVVLPLVLTWASDTGAYAFGRAFGMRKLIPSVSPGKTVAGAVGALATSVVACWLYVRFVLRPAAQLAMSPAAIVGFALAVSVAAQVGDLAESLLKREAGVKDSSHIIPGHGGILDRFDSLLFVLPVAYMLLGWHLLLPAPQ